MPEDAVIGFRFFDGNGPSIVNEQAQFRASEHLLNSTAFNAAYGNLGTAIQAVQEAARNKAGRDLERFDEFEPSDFIEGFDFIL